MRRLEGLDGLRGCLALYVMASHIAPFAAVAPGWGWLPEAVSHGQAAVDVFFILSGLVIVSSVQAFGGRAAPFLVARLGRIYPVFVVCFAAALAVAALAPGYERMPWLGTLAPDIWPHGPADAWWGRLAAHLSLAHGLLPQAVLPDVWVSFLGSAWSLSTEMQFYCLIAVFGMAAGGRTDPSPRAAARLRGDPVLHAATARTGLLRCARNDGRTSEASPFAPGLMSLPIGLLAAAAIGLAWQAWAPPGARFSRAFLPLAAQYFALGIASVAVVRGAPGARRFFGLVLFGTVALCLPGGADKALPPLFWTFCLAAELGWRPLRLVRRLLRAAPTRWLGAISYCLYLVHEPVQKLVGIASAWAAGGDGARFNLLFLPLAVALPLAAASVLHRWIEQPGIAWSRAVARRLARPTVPAIGGGIEGAAPLSGG